MGTGSRFNTGDDFGVLTDTGYSACIDLETGKVEGTLNRAPFQYAVRGIYYANTTCSGTPQARSEQPAIPFYGGFVISDSNAEGLF